MAEQMIQHKEGEKVATQAIPAGFKWTEIGIIPEDWIIEKLGMYASFRTGPFGSALHKSDYVIDGIPIVNPMQIIDGGIIPTSSMSISTTAATKLSEFRLQTGDIVIGRRGEMGRCAVVGIEENGWLCGTGSMIIRIKSSCESRFIQRVLSSKEIIAAIESSSVGTTMINLNQSTLRELKIFIPSNKNEQLAIATVLSDTDALIGELEQLVAKKQGIKTAAMQQLLTGRTRLPQFALRPDGTPKGYKSSELGQIPEDWEIKTIYELADYQKFLFDDGDWVEAEHITDHGTRLIQTGNIGIGRYVEKENKKYISDASFDKLKCKLLQEGDLLICRLAEPAGRACILPNIGESKVITSVDVSIFRPSKKTAYRDFYNQYFSFSEWFKTVLEQVGGTTHKRIARGALGRLPVPYPKLEEQTAIATILSDMDSELSSLEQKLAKARSLKQGMMQQLLTGRIRLPLPQEA
ncbi:MULTISPECIES: restriction endonuclease subunit S [Aeromonas]|uniref:restriction endonuclease subunit S n=1 Tax=Aeromonas TaxID=642 RepID=UPI0022E575C7|nr:MULTISPECIES: restriction endonuclease subunit S [Aeromonas]MDM5123085.1 restriction endonuclease subunit S [Aeromonas rivipollensis]